MMLHAYDSRRQALTAHLALKGERLSPMVDYRAAVYPVTIDPLISSKTKLTASGRRGIRHVWGTPFSADGRTAVVG